MKKILIGVFIACNLLFNTAFAVEQVKLQPKIDYQRIAPIIKNEAANSENRSNQNKVGFLKNLFSEYGVQLLALIVSVVGLFMAISGFTFANRKKKKSTKKLINDIDSTFHEYKWKSKRCEAELYRMHDEVEEHLKKGKIDEGTYQLLIGRIEKYLKEIREVGNQKD